MLTIAVGILTLDSRLGLLYHSAFRWFPGAQQSEPTAVSTRKDGILGAAFGRSQNPKY